MSINEASINAKFEKWKKSAAGKLRQKEVIDSHSKSGKPLASGSYVFDEERMKWIAEQLRQMIVRRLPNSIADVANELVVLSPKKIRNGQYEVTLHFKPSALHRDSLETTVDLGYDGIDNIVALFNNGYHARNYVEGWWHGHTAKNSGFVDSDNDRDLAWVTSKKEREPLSFMQDAENEFNSLYGNKYMISLQLGSDYDQ